MLTRVARNHYVLLCNLQLFVLKMTLKRRRKSELFEGSPERSTMEKNKTLNVKNKKKLTKLSSTSSELVSSSSQQSACSLLASFASRTSVELVKRKNRGIFTTTWILLLTILNLVSSSSSASSKTFLFLFTDTPIND